MPVKYDITAGKQPIKLIFMPAEVPCRTKGDKEGNPCHQTPDLRCVKGRARIGGKKVETDDK